MSDNTIVETANQGAQAAPFGYKKDGTPRKRPAPVRRAQVRRNVLEQTSPDFDARPVNIQATRRSRGRMDGSRRRLPNIKLPPGWVGHWFVDDDGDPEKGTCGSRIQYAYNNDWNFVRLSESEKSKYEITGDNLGSNMSVVANRRVGGANQYFMAKKLEMFEEDRQNGVEKINDDIEAALRPDRAIKATVAGGNPNFYTAERDVPAEPAVTFTRPGTT